MQLDDRWSGERQKNIAKYRWSTHTHRAAIVFDHDGNKYELAAVVVCGMKIGPAWKAEKLPAHTTHKKWQLRANWKIPNFWRDTNRGRAQKMLARRHTIQPSECRMVSFLFLAQAFLFFINQSDFFFCWSSNELYCKRIVKRETKF